MEQTLANIILFVLAVKLTLVCLVMCVLLLHVLVSVVNYYLKKLGLHCSILDRLSSQI